jgi:hypothetical protein
MLCPKTWVLKQAKSLGIETPPKPTKNLGPNRNPSIGGRTRSLGDQDQAQRCMRQLSMIPTKKFEPKHLRIKGTSRARKTDENSSKKTRKSNELQTGNRCNRESFHSLGGQILYKLLKNLTLESKENEKQSGWIVCLETLELIYMSPLRPRQKTTLPLALKLRYNPSGANRSCSTPLHRTTTPLLQTASSRRKPCDPAMRPPASKLLSAPGSRLRPPSLRSWFCGSTK